MTADPQDTVSEITEITGEQLARAIGAFFHAIGWGALAGSGVFLMFTVPVGVIAMFAAGDPRGLLMGLFPLVFALAGALAGMTLIGLPLTAFLRHLQRERAATYATIGVVSGAALPVLFAGWFEGEFNSGSIGAGLFLGLFGAMAGGVTGNIWGTYREQLANREPEPPGSDDRTANPFHDMIH